MTADRVSAQDVEREMGVQKKERAIGFCRLARCFPHIDPVAEQARFHTGNRATVAPSSSVTVMA